MNIERLRQIEKHILQKPRRFFMRQLQYNGAPGEKFEGDHRNTQTVPECGTVACIAGWSDILWPEWRDLRLMFVGQGALDLDNSQAARLFLDHEWPEPFRSQYRDARTARQRVKIAVARIEHMISTGL